MGVIYSASEVFETGVPQPHSHMQAADMVYGYLEAHPDIPKFAIHGSVTEGRHNLRSDLDVVGLYDVEVEREGLIADELAAFYEGVKQKTGVHVEPNTWPLVEPVDARRSRMYDKLYVHHLYDAMQSDEWAVGGVDQVVEELLAEQEEYGPDKFVEIVLGYLAYKRSGFTKAPSVFDGTDKSMTSFQRIIEFPNSTRRKILQLCDLTGGEFGGELQEVLENREITDLTQELFFLSELDREYTMLLPRFISGESNRIVYEDYLAELYTTAKHKAAISARKISDHLGEWQSEFRNR